MRINNISNTSFNAKIVLAEKNNALIKKSIKSSFNHEHLRDCLDEIYRFQPQTVLLVQMEQLEQPKYEGATHKIIITNKNNEQTITKIWGEKGVYSWTFGHLIDRLTKLKDEVVYEFWTKPAIEKEYIPKILKHEIFADEYDFDYDKHLKECEQKEAMQKLSNKLEKTSSSLDDMIREYEYEKNKNKQQDRYSTPVRNNHHSSFNSEEDSVWSEIRRIKKLREDYPQLYSKQNEEKVIWAATMGRNCNK